MSTHTPTQVTAPAAQAAANQFLSEHLPDRFTADQAERDGEIWRVPVIIAYPFVGSIGQVGEVLINAETEQVVSCTPIDEMKTHANSLYKAHRDQIQGRLSIGRKHPTPVFPLTCASFF